jgi:mono/diheme cytochrome c family protein
MAAPVEAGNITRPPDWLASHAADPIAIAPGVRQPPFSNQEDTRAIVAALARMRSSSPPAVTEAEADTLVTFNRECLVCHTVDGAGGTDGPDLSNISATLDAAAIAAQIRNPFARNADTMMPAFEGILTDDQIRGLAEFQSRR